MRAIAYLALVLSLLAGLCVAQHIATANGLNSSIDTPSG